MAAAAGPDLGLPLAGPNLTNLRTLLGMEQNHATKPKKAAIEAKNNVDLNSR